MAQRGGGYGYNVHDSVAERISIPVQSTDDTVVKEYNTETDRYYKNADVSLQSLDSGMGSMSLQHSLSYPSATGSSYDQHLWQRVYRMDHPKRGHFIIINNRTFDKRTSMRERPGTDVDAANLFTVFKQLGFSIDLQSNLRVDQMLGLVIDYARLADQKDCDCFAMAILSHGDEGQVYGTDGVINLRKLIEPLKDSKLLAGKPKLIFMQACRGTEFDEGMNVTDAEVSNEPQEDQVYRLPKEADFLYAYSTAPGFHTFRNSTQGSIYITALTKIFREQGASAEITRILTQVNREVAQGFESKTANPAQNRKKQAPSFESMLTKDLFFPPKK